MAFPVLAITPMAVLPGPFDPGGVGARIITVVSALVGAAGLAAAVRSRQSHRMARRGER